jgi:trimethylamine---corrinoid protein Co-methyltransferase
MEYINLRILAMNSTSNRRKRRNKSRQPARLKQLPKQQLVNPYQPVEPLSSDQIETIHQASLRLLRDTGVDFLLPEAVQRLKKAGAMVEDGSERVRFDPAMVEETIGLAPQQITLHARNPHNNIILGGKNVCFDTVSSAPNASDIINGRRSGNIEDFRNFVKLGQHFNIISCIGGYPVEPIEWHSSIRHLQATRDMLHLSDKPLRGYATERNRMLDAMEMIRIARAISHEQMEQEPSIMTTINVNSPLILDTVMLEGIIEMASRNQLIILTPFTLAGAMAPVSLAAAITQQNAEALAGYVFAQIVRPGAPVMYGAFTSNVDMKSGSPAFGTPEYMKTAQIGGQLARRYGLPYRSSNVCSANSVDAQAAYESVFSLWGAMMGGCNLLKHGAGWLEGGLCASFEKFILDIDLLQMVAEYLKPVDLSDDEIALDVIDGVGPGGHFFGTEHTQQRYRDAFYAPLVSDWRNFESWQEAGSPQAYDKAQQVCQQALAEYQQPPLDEAIRDELDEFVERRSREGGAVTNF